MEITLCSCSPPLMNLISPHYPSLHSVSLIQNNTPSALVSPPPPLWRNTKKSSLFSVSLFQTQWANHAVVAFISASSHSHRSIHALRPLRGFPVQCLNNLSKFPTMDPFAHNALEKAKVKLTSALINNNVYTWEENSVSLLMNRNIMLRILSISRAKQETNSHKIAVIL